jgi:hypothetical protein
VAHGPSEVKRDFALRVFEVDFEAIRTAGVLAVSAIGNCDLDESACRVSIAVRIDRHDHARTTELATVSTDCHSCWICHFDDNMATLAIPSLFKTKLTSRFS